MTLCVPPLHQMLLYLFYVLPFFCLCIYGLLRPGCSWMPDWSLVFAGAVAQVGGFSPSQEGVKKGGGWGCTRIWSSSQSRCRSPIITFSSVDLIRVGNFDRNRLERAGGCRNRGLRGGSFGAGHPMKPPPCVPRLSSPTWAPRCTPARPSPTRPPKTSGGASSSPTSSTRWGRSSWPSAACAAPRSSCPAPPPAWARSTSEGGAAPPKKSTCSGTTLAEVSPGMLRSPFPRTPMSPWGAGGGTWCTLRGRGCSWGGLGGVARPPAHPDAPRKDGTTPGKKMFTK